MHTVYLYIKKITLWVYAGVFCQPLHKQHDLFSPPSLNLNFARVACLSVTLSPQL